MYIQLALDRMTVDKAIKITKEVNCYIDWIEVGTSLIKEFGIKSIYTIKNVFPDKPLVADIKTIDNAKYECELCFEAGADIITVMGVAPLVTIETCLNEAAKRKRNIMIDLLNVNETTLRKLIECKDAIFCAHLSKDEQELSVSKAEHSFDRFNILEDRTLAIAGGISIDSIEKIKPFNPLIIIVGSAITQAADKVKAARELKQSILFMED
ncbi:3-hexulose-6-phosphate synthase [Thermaerobacillus caldiproteolyticus]|uniref:3-hexulose-6-phosphate synthase n=1 Tax=Thermaerobacillus caldiproteolyticus TaxID=247480 RepID=UPI00188B23CC|nr:3-hexulose-6-phosphate synthase [Anoxybacillus caldiproteolyticus]QPA32621.1 orotidine 5'-phosphate decarboxylase [Anoxybacillus caldiproteolyticus]